MRALHYSVLLAGRIDEWTHPDTVRPAIIDVVLEPMVTVYGRFESSIRLVL
jgi:hypothetical protein